MGRLCLRCVRASRAVLFCALDTEPGEITLIRDNHFVEGPAPDPTGQPPAGVEALRSGGDERELVAAVLRKDRKAAAQFVAAHIDAVYGYARLRLTPRVDLVDDVVQDVFLAALNGLATFQGHASLRTWLLGIARHKIEDLYRQRLRVPLAPDGLDGVEEESLANTIPLDEAIDAARMREKTRHVLARMPERYGLMLVWRYWEQRSTREIAVAIEATEKSVERTLARARARFKELWLEE
jgi:RNA polymerase sigma-70 factor (ECF subfamily)